MMSLCPSFIRIHIHVLITLIFPWHMSSLEPWFHIVGCNPLEEDDIHVVGPNQHFKKKKLKKDKN